MDEERIKNAFISSAKAKIDAETNERVEQEFKRRSKELVDPDDPTGNQEDPAVT